MKEQHLNGQNKTNKYHVASLGFSIIEVLLAGSIFILLVTAFVGTYLYGQEATALAGSRASATFIAEGGLEAVRNIRDSDYTALTDGIHGLATTSSQWIFSGSSDTVGAFTRKITISPFGTNGKVVVSNVTWKQNAQRAGSVSLVTLLTNWVVAGANTWASPIQSASVNVAGNNNGNKIQVQGNYAYMVRTSGTPDFIIFDVSNPASPTISGSLSLPGNPKNIFVSGKYAYVVSSSNSQELQIINISNPTSPVIVGTYNAPGNANANGIYVVGTTAYMVRTSSRDNEFVVLDVSAPSNPVLVGSLNLRATGYEVIVSGKYAYIASARNNQELQIVNISNPHTPVFASSLNLPGNTNAITIALSGTLAFLGQGSTFYTIDMLTPTDPTILGSVSTSGTLNDIALNTGNAGTYVFLATSNVNEELQVANISTPSNPTIFGSFDVSGSGSLLGVAYSAVLDRAFGASTVNNEELVVFAP